MNKIVILFCFISQDLSGNSDKNSVVASVFSSPFAAQFVRILPKNHNNKRCMRVDLFGCRDCKCSPGLQIISRLAPVKLAGQTYFSSDISHFWPDKH